MFIINVSLANPMVTAAWPLELRRWQPLNHGGNFSLIYVGLTKVKVRNRLSYLQQVYSLAGW